MSNEKTEKPVNVTPTKDAACCGAVPSAAVETPKDRMVVAKERMTNTAQTCQRLSRLLGSAANMLQQGSGDPGFGSYESAAVGQLKEADHVIGQMVGRSGA